MDTDCIWGTDMGIRTFSEMLDFDIFVANLHSDVKRNECHSTWYRYCSNYHKCSDPALYLANRSYHYEPVINLFIVDILLSILSSHSAITLFYNNNKCQFCIRITCMAAVDKYRNSLYYIVSIDIYYQP